MKQTLHILVALMVAVPLAAGGLCCCLLGTDGADAGPAAEVPASCCSQGGASAPASSSPDDGEGDCGCPTLDTLLLTKSVPAADAPLPDVQHLAGPAAAPTGSVADATPRTALPARTAHAPPKLPIYRKLSALLC